MLNLQVHSTVPFNQVRVPAENLLTHHASYFLQAIGGQLTEICDVVILRLISCCLPGSYRKKMQKERLSGHPMLWRWNSASVGHCGANLFLNRHAKTSWCMYVGIRYLQVGGIVVNSHIQCSFCVKQGRQATVIHWSTEMHWNPILAIVHPPSYCAWLTKQLRSLNSYWYQVHPGRF